MRIATSVSMTMLWLACLPACGGGDSSGGKVNYSVDDSKQVSQVSDAEAVAMCKQTMEALEKAVPKSASCTLSGLFVASLAGGDKKVCQETYDECMKKPDEPDDEDTCKLDDEDSKLTDCPVTVGEFEKCINDTIAAVHDVYDGLSCDTDPKSLEDIGDDLEPASCKAIEAKCPELAEDDEE